MIINWCKVGAALERSFLPVLGVLVLLMLLIFLWFVSLFIFVVVWVLATWLVPTMPVLMIKIVTGVISLFIGVNAFVIWYKLFVHWDG